MRARSGIGLALLLMVTAVGCDHPVSQAEFDTLQQQHNTLRGAFNTLRTGLNTWSASVFAWQSRTYLVLCDVAAKNPPMSKYAQDTRDYCGPSDGNGEPDPPPDFGDS